MSALPSELYLQKLIEPPVAERGDEHLPQSSPALGKQFSAILFVPVVKMKKTAMNANHSEEQAQAGLDRFFSPNQVVDVVHHQDADHQYDGDLSCVHTQPYDITATMSSL